MHPFEVEQLTDTAQENIEMGHCAKSFSAVTAIKLIGNFETGNKFQFVSRSC